LGSGRIGCRPILAPAAARLAAGSASATRVTRDSTSGSRFAEPAQG
jgi:hypothetical protein